MFKSQSLFLCSIKSHGVGLWDFGGHYSFCIKQPFVFALENQIGCTAGSSFDKCPLRALYQVICTICSFFKEDTKIVFKCFPVILIFYLNVKICAKYFIFKILINKKKPCWTLPMCIFHYINNFDCVKHLHKAGTWKPWQMVWCQNVSITMFGVDNAVCAQDVVVMPCCLHCLFCLFSDFAGYLSSSSFQSVKALQIPQ